MRLIHDDCRNALQELIDEGVTVDLIVTSPPYNLNQRVHTGRYTSASSVKNKHKILAKYDTYTDDLSMEDYYNFQSDVIDKCLILSDTLFYNIQMVTGNKVALFKLIGKYADKIKEIIIWDKCNSQPAINKGVLNSQYEFIIVFQNSKPYNRTFDKRYFDRGTETNVWRIRPERNKYHKASFPMELVERILNNFTEKGDVVLDPFMGSGTTGLVCLENDRDFIGIELDEEYYNITVERCKKYQTKLV